MSTFGAAAAESHFFAAFFAAAVVRAVAFFAGFRAVPIATLFAGPPAAYSFLPSGPLPTAASDAT